MNDTARYKHAFGLFTNYNLERLLAMSSRRYSDKHYVGIDGVGDVAVLNSQFRLDMNAS